MMDLPQSFKALADETRLLCLALLVSEGELCVCDFEVALGATQSKTSRHLRYLLNAGFVSDRREGTWVHYRISKEIAPEQKALLKIVAEFCESESLKAARQKLRKFRNGKKCSS